MKATNAFAESFVGSLKRECLEHCLCFSRGQLHYILTTWLRHYNTLRAHQGLGIDNNVLEESFEPQATGPVRFRLS